MRIEELKFDDIINNKTGIFAISLVSFPAINVDFQYFSKDVEEIYNFKTENLEKRIITGPALIPNALIPRIDDDEKDMYQVFFGKETVELLAYNYLINLRLNSVTEQHLFNVKDVYMIESYILKEEKEFNGKKLPIGTWMASYKILNDEIWNKIKGGELKGFSVESFIKSMIIQNSKIKKDDSVESIEIKELKKLLEIE